MQPQDPFKQQPAHPQQPVNPHQPAGQGGYPTQPRVGQQYPGQQQYPQQQSAAQQYPAQQYEGESQPGAAAPGGYQQPGWYQTEPPKRRTGLIVGISAAVVVVAVTALILVLTMSGNSRDTASTATPTATGAGVLPGALTTSGASATSAGPLSSAGPTSVPPATGGAVPAGNALTSRATLDRVAQLISSGQPNVASVYACAAERQTFITQNTLPAGVTAMITVTNVTENGATAQGSFTVKAQNTATGQTQDGQDTVSLQRNNAGAWLICKGALAAEDQSLPNEANAPAGAPVGSRGQVAPTTAEGGTPGADQATQVAQSWAAAINAGDTATAQQYLCSSYQGTPGGTSTGVTLTLQRISQTGQDTATAEFLVNANGQEATAQVAMKVENSRWTICQQG